MNIRRIIRESIVESVSKNGDGVAKLISHITDTEVRTSELQHINYKKGKSGYLLSRYETHGYLPRRIVKFSDIEKIGLTEEQFEKHLGFDLKSKGH